MSSNLDVFQTYFEASRANPIEAIKHYLADGFQTFDIDGSVQMNRESYMGLVQLLHSAFKDLETVLSDVREEEDNVFVSSHFEGTHTGDLDLSAMGMGVIPASGKRIVWPEASSKWGFEGGKIASIQATSETSGLGPFLAALGVTPPAA